MIASALTAAPAVFADNIVNDDLIVQGKLCQGIDCTNGQAFDTEHVRLRENNTRTTFIDMTADPAAQSWRLVANDRVSGGRDNFQFHVQPDLSETDDGTPYVYFGTQGHGGVALGKGSEIVGGEVSVGATDLERRIVNIARGLAATDIGTVGDIAAGADNLDARLDQLEAQLADIENTNSALDTLAAELDDIAQIIETAEQSKLMKSGGGAAGPSGLLVLLGGAVLFRLRRVKPRKGGLQ
jgi:hypothetical protein